MKKIILFVSIIILSLSAATAFANTPESKTGSDNGTVPVKNEVKLSGEDFNRLTKSDREIRKMDNSETTVQEGRRRGHGVIVGERHRRNGVVYIGGGTILIIILIILLV